MDLKESKDEYRGRFGEEKEKGKKHNYAIISKNKNEIRTSSMWMQIFSKFCCMEK